MPVVVPIRREIAATDRQFATTLAKGLEILRCFTPVKPVLGNSELAEKTMGPALVEMVRQLHEKAFMA